MSAVQQLGYRHSPPINHSICWRDRDTGFHSNDVESEFNRFKRWVRGRYGQLKFDTTAPLAEEDEEGHIETDFCEGELYEYTFYTNIGSSMKKVMAAIAYVNGRQDPLLRF